MCTARHKYLFTPVDVVGGLESPLAMQHEVQHLSWHVVASYPGPHITVFPLEGLVTMVCAGA